MAIAAEQRQRELRTLTCCWIESGAKRNVARFVPIILAALVSEMHVADKILNHQAGTISGVAAVYQRHDFLAEREEALDRWGGHVGELVQAEVRTADS